MRLYVVTEQPRYMMLASYFIGQRGATALYDEEYRGQTSCSHLRPGVVVKASRPSASAAARRRAAVAARYVLSI